MRGFLGSYGICLYERRKEMWLRDGGRGVKGFEICKLKDLRVVLDMKWFKLLKDLILGR